MWKPSGIRLRDCAICGQPVVSRPYQSNAARTCQPVCARTLAVREHPDIDQTVRLNRVLS